MQCCPHSSSGSWLLQDSDNLPPRSLWFPNARSGIVALHAVLFQQTVHEISAYFTKV